MFKKFKVQIIILGVLAIMAAYRFNEVYTDKNLVKDLEEKFSLNNIPIEVNYKMTSTESGHLQMMKYDLGNTKYYDISTAVLYMNPEYRKNPYVLAHEFGHVVGVTYFNDDTDAFADSYARYYFKESLSGTTDDWIIEAILLLNDAEVYDEKEFKKILEEQIGETKYARTDINQTPSSTEVNGNSITPETDYNNQIVEEQPTESAVTIQETEIEKAESEYNKHKEMMSNIDPDKIVNAYMTDLQYNTPRKYQAIEGTYSKEVLYQNGYIRYDEQYPIYAKDDHIYILTVDGKLFDMTPGV